MIRTLSAACLCAAIACGTAGTTDKITDTPPPTDPIIHLDRNPILVGATVGTRATANLQITNIGAGELRIDSLRLTTTAGGTPADIDGGGVFDQPVIQVDAGVDGGDTLPVQIAGVAGFVQFDYQPVDGSPTHLQLLIDSNAPATPHLVVPVVGCGILPDGGGDVSDCTCTDGGC
jgi:hypothetical protein